jgi:hypothetical protein|tara:strand:- start:150 stop:365 length:216 start_codon:yes stop_codon:yes gene_type:complete
MTIRNIHEARPGSAWDQYQKAGHAWRADNPDADKWDVRAAARAFAASDSWCDAIAAVKCAAFNEGARKGAK